MPFNLHDQWSACRAVIRRPDGTSIELGGEAGKAKSSDITAGTVVKDLGSPCGGFSLTLQPFQQYLDVISVNDWIEIFLDNGDGEETAMLGLVDRVGRSRRVVDQRGSENENIQVIGRDWGKVLVQTQLMFDPVLGQGIRLGALLEAYATWNRSSPSQRVAATPDTVLSFYIDQLLTKRQQFIGPKGDPVGKMIVQEFTPSEVGGNIFFLSNLNINGVLWNLLECNAIRVLNELFTDWNDGMPSLVLREYPYDREKFSALNAIKLPSSFVAEENFAKGDHDVANWFRLHVDWAGRPEVGIAAGAKLGYANPASIAKHGLRRFEQVVAGLFPAGGTNIPRLADPITVIEKATQKVAAWYCNNDLFYAGSVRCGLLPTAKVGSRVDYTNARSGDALSFYLEGINHQFAYGEKSSSFTNMQLTRGVPYDDGNFNALLSFDQRMSSTVDKGLALVALRDTNLLMDLYSLNGNATVFPPLVLE